MKQIFKLLQKAFFISLLGLSSGMISAQSFSISGKLFDANDSTVLAASIILANKLDSSYVQGVVSDMDGRFTIDNIKSGDYLLFIQHILYEKKDLSVNVNENINLGNIILHEKENELGEVTVKATRPIVKMENNVLSYDASVISEKKVHTSALEVLGDIPGVMLKGDDIELLGSDQLNIAINGKPTTLTYDQVISMLKSMPNTSVKKVQVMYAPPAKYNVKGALINIVLNRAEVNKINGSVNVGYRQRREAGALGGLNLQYAKNKWEFDFLYSYDYDHRVQKNQIDIDHLYRDTLYQIKQNMRFPNKSQTHLFQANSRFYIDSVQTLSFTYSGDFSNDKGGPNTTVADFSSIKDVYTERDTSTEKSSEKLHNLKLDYEWANRLNMGVDYTYYKSPSDNYYNSVVENTASRFMTSSGQTINKWMIYGNHTFNIGATTFSYGANFSYTGNKNYYKYYDSNDGIYSLDESQSTENDFNEIATSGFISFSKQFSSHFTFDFTLKGEFDRMRKDSLGNSKNIWNTFYLYPTLNASFMPDAEMNHIFQLAVKSYTTYPSYWEISPATWYTNQYMLVQGNPELKPSQTYSSTLTYIYKRKYMAILSHKYIHNLISQIPYASNESFNTIARNENVDFENDFSLMFVVPFSIGPRIQVTPTAGYFYRKMKKKSPEEQAFDRKSGIFIFQCDNSFMLMKKCGLKANLSGYYYGGGIQGIYDFSDSYGVSMGVSCNLLKDKAMLSLKVDDLFNSQIPDLHINYKNQKSHYNLDQDTRLITLTFRYLFGKPIKSKKVDIDNSRFRRMN